MKRVISTVAIAVAALVVLSAVGGEDLRVAKAEEAYYCKGVRDGIWPDYRGIYERVCNKPIPLTAEAR